MIAEIAEFRGLQAARGHGDADDINGEKIVVDDGAAAAAVAAPPSRADELKARLCPHRRRGRSAS